MKYKILIVEDEPEIVRLIPNRLDKEKFDVTIVMDGTEALKLIETRHYDLGADESKNRDKSGFGLGLSIARNLALKRQNF